MRRRTLDARRPPQHRGPRAPDRPDHEPAGLGPRAHRRLRGPLARPPPRGLAAAAPRPRRALRRLRDAARRARRPRAPRPRRRARLPRRGARAHARRAGAPRRRPGHPRDGPAPRAAAHRDDAPGDGDRGAAAARRARAARAGRRRTGWLESPAGTFALGAPDGGFAYDNERPRHAVDARRLRDRPPAGHQRAPGCASPRAAATCAASGGPTRAGRGRRSTTSRTTPAWRPGTRDAPVCHVSCFEADALAGGAEPGSPPRPSGRRRRPRTSLDGVGHVWEWTASPFTRLPRLPRPSRTASTPRSSSATGYRVLRGGSWATAPARRHRHVPQLGPPRAPADLRRRAAGPRPRGADLMEPDDLHRRATHRRRVVPRRRRGAHAGRRRPRRPHPPVQGAAAQALLRRARRRAVRPDLRAARVLPDALRAGDPRGPRRATSSRATGAAELVELGSGTAAKTRLLLARDGRGRHAATATCPIDVTESMVRALRAARWSASSPGCACTASSATSSATSTTSRRRSTAARASSRSSAGRSATSRRAAAGASCARWRRCSATTATCCSAPTSSRTRRSSRPPTTTAPGVTAAFNRNVLHVLNRELDADFEPDAFDHVAFFDRDREWIEMRLRARRPQRVHGRRARPAA